MGKRRSKETFNVSLEDIKLKTDGSNPQANDSNNQLPEINRQDSGSDQTPTASSTQSEIASAGSKRVPRKRREFPNKIEAFNRLPEVFVEELGIVERVSKRLGILDKTVYEWMREYPEMAALKAKVIEHWANLAHRKMDAFLTHADPKIAIKALELILKYKAHQFGMTPMNDASILNSKPTEVNINLIPIAPKSKETDDG